LNEGQGVITEFGDVCQALRGYVRHSRKSSYSFVTIRTLLTRCGARMPLTNIVGSHAQ